MSYDVEAKITSSRHWPFAKLVINLLRRRFPLTGPQIRSAISCPGKELHSIIYVARRYIERVEKGTLNRGLGGYYIGVSIGDRIDHRTDIAARVVSGMKRYKECESLTGNPDPETLSIGDRESLHMHRAFSHVFNAALAIADDNKRLLIKSDDSKRRLAEAEEKTKHPFPPLDPEENLVGYARAVVPIKKDIK